MSSPAETYETYMVPSLFARCAETLIERADPQPGDRILDLACGTGIVARQAARHVGGQGQIVGLDLSPAMLEVARATAEREGVAIIWHEGRAEQLPFPDSSFDLVLSQQGLQFVPDKPAAVAEMYRVLADGGRVVISVWQGIDQHPFYKRLDDVFMQRLGMPSIEGPFSFGDADELRELLEGAGFRDVTVEPVSFSARFPDPEHYIALQVPAAVAAVPSMQQLDENERQELIEAVREDMREPIRERTEDNHLVVPFHAHLAKGRR